MKLNLEQIKNITLGAVCVEEENGKFRFHRFTEEQEALYGRISAEQDRSFNKRCMATAGVKLWFKTNSKALKLNLESLESTSRHYYSFDVFVNGNVVGYLDNFSNTEMPAAYTKVVLPRGKAEKEFDLGVGDKEVCIYFPWSICPIFEEIGLDDNAYIEPIKPDKKLLAFGDSITQGYDALRPSGSYISILSDRLHAEVLNKGIGGEVFFPDLAKTKDNFSPDYITVAYGTNDFGTRSYEDFKVRCKEFFEELSRNYPTSKIFAITPIWRKDHNGERVFGAFFKVEEYIKTVCENLENVTVISGFDLVPKDEKYYSDLRLHPNDKGFKYYADNLYNEISKILEKESDKG